MPLTDNLIRLIEHFCLQDDLKCYDPYDVWKTELGKKTKSIFYQNKWLGMPIAAVLSFFDFFINNALRLGYRKQEYPMVRALGALSLLELYHHTKREPYLQFAEKHIRWLIKNYSNGYSGYCWGMNTWWVSKNGIYKPETPYITNTPYVLEALIKFREITGKQDWDPVIKSVLNFIEKDLFILHEDPNSLALSYAPVQEKRIVINANSYTLYVYALLLAFFPEKQEYIKNKIYRLYRFITSQQKPDGSWYYYADNHTGNFIDCFHSCFILKNIYKASSIYPMESSDSIIQKGYKYLKDNFYEPRKNLAKRFSVSDKPSLVKFDLYDNAEMLNIALLLNDKEFAKHLSSGILNSFVKNKDIYSLIDLLGIKRNKNTLRWAVMPYLLALAKMEQKVAC